MSNDATPQRAVDTTTGPAESHRATLAGRVDRYLLLERLGEGGMGVVWAAHDPELDRNIAIKVMHPERSGTRSQARLLREAQAMAKLSHPNVVQVHDVGTAGDTVFLAMELVAGRTMGAWLSAESRSWRDIVTIFVQAARGLAAAHTAGIVHRDFKPDNVLIADDGRVCVADFGIAGALAESETEDGQVRESPALVPLTRTGALVGTPRYMAPEQHAGREVGPAADQFSFCVALHEALHGQAPYAGGSLAELATNTMEGRYREPKAPSGAPRWVGQAVRRGLNVDPSDRHPSLDALITILERDGARRRHLRGGLVGGALAVAAGSALWFALAAGAPTCAGASAEMEALWSGPKSGILATLDANGEARVLDSARPVIATIDRYAEGWVAAHTGICKAYQSGSVSAARLDASVTCLESHKAALATVIGLLAAPNSVETLDRLGMTAAKLPSVFRCTDHASLARTRPTPEDATQAAAVADVWRRAAELTVRHDAGDVLTAAEALERLVAEAETLRYGPLVADLSLTVGRLAMDRKDWVSAQRHLERATLRGVAGGTDAVAAEAEARAVFLDAMVSEDPRVGLRRRAMAEALAERAGNPANIRSLIANNVGVAHSIAGDVDQATPLFIRALELADLAEVAEPVDPLDRIGILSNLAMHTADPGARDRLFARAEAMMAGTVGESHYQRLDLVVRRAKYADDAAWARRTLAAVCRQFVDRPGDDVMRCYSCSYRLAELEDLEGRARQASIAATQAAACVESQYEPADMPADLAAFVAKARGHAALLANELQFADRRLGEAAEILQPQHEIPWVALEVADVALLRARTAVALGRVEGVGDDLTGLVQHYEAAATRSFDQALRFHRQQALDLLQRLSSIPSASTQR